MSSDPHTKAPCSCDALSIAPAMRPDTEINTTVASSTEPMETDVTNAITRPARGGSLVAYLATNRVAVSPRPTPAINPAMPSVDWMRPNSPKESCPSTRAARIIATNTRIRAVAEPNRLQSEPRARRFAMEDVVSRSYRNEGRIFLPIARTIDSIDEKTTRKTLRTGHKRCHTPEAS